MMQDFYSYNSGFGHPYAGVALFFTLIFWGLVIWAIVALVRNTRCHGHHCRHQEGQHEHHGHHHIEGEKNHEKGEDKAIAILKERYAKGDISKEEFQEKKAELLK
jgi:uncharacterized membrane protein